MFGGSVGPIRKQLPSGQFQNVYEGVKVRAQPLPLRVPTSPQQTAAQQHTQVNQIQLPIVKNSSQSIITPTSSPALNPQSPILTNLLHKSNSSEIEINNASNLDDTKVCLEFKHQLSSNLIYFTFNQMHGINNYINILPSCPKFFYSYIIQTELGNSQT